MLSFFSCWGTEITCNVLHKLYKMRNICHDSVVKEILLFISQRSTLFGPRGDFSFFYYIGLLQLSQVLGLSDNVYSFSNSYSFIW